MCDSALEKDIRSGLAIVLNAFFAFVGFFLFAVPFSVLIDAQPQSGICATVAGLIGAVIGFLLGKRLTKQTANQSWFEMCLWLAPTLLAIAGVFMLIGLLLK